MNRRSFLSFLAAVPILGRLIPKESVTVSREKVLPPRKPIGEAMHTAGTIQAGQPVYFTSDGKVAAWPPSTQRTFVWDSYEGPIETTSIVGYRHET